MPHYNVLFLCTGNSARSIMAEAIMNHLGAANFTAYSAGSHPAGIVRPEALEILEKASFDTSNLRSKSWDEFAKPDAPHLHFIFTVCDRAAEEVCPVWPGQPMTAHWGIPDPVSATGTQQDRERAYGQAFSALSRRISIFLCLPIEGLEPFILQQKLDEIGKS